MHDPERPWAIRPSLLHSTARDLSRRGSDLAQLAEQRGLGPEALPTPHEIEVLLNGKAVAASRSADGQDDALRVIDGVAVLGLQGLITPRPSFLSLLFGYGGGGLLEFRDQLREAIAHSDVESVLIDVNSPGGYVDLVPEVAAEIRDCPKPTLAIANTDAGSAAYWLASQADELSVTPSGFVGSVGVYQLHADWSKFDQEIGVNYTFLSAGRYKTEGNEHEPLDKEAHEGIMIAVDDIYTMFVDAVADGRGVGADEVRAGYGEGRMVMAGRAVDLNMADRVETIDQALARLLGGSAGSAAIAAATHTHAAGTLSPHAHTHGTLSPHAASAEADNAEAALEDEVSSEDPPTTDPPPEEEDPPPTDAVADGDDDPFDDLESETELKARRRRLAEALLT